MEILNRSKECVIAANARVASAPIAQLIGLIGKKEFAPGEGLWLPYCSGVHSAFLQFPIDVVLADSQFRVLEVVHNLRPWRATKLILKARYALELPAGTLAATRTEVGDLLRVADTE